VVGRKAVEGNDYGLKQMALDGAVAFAGGTVAGGVAGLKVGGTGLSLGSAAARLALGERVAAEDASAGVRLVERLIQGGVDGAAGGAAGATASRTVDPETWRNGFKAGLLQVTGGALIGMAVGAGTGAGTSAISGHVQDMSANRAAQAFGARVIGAEDVEAFQARPSEKARRTILQVASSSVNRFLQHRATEREEKALAQQEQADEAKRAR
jgi:hypothetical protein